MSLVGRNLQRYAAPRPTAELEDNVEAAWLDSSSRGFDDDRFSPSEADVVKGFGQGLVEHLEEVIKVAAEESVDIFRGASLEP